MNVTTVDAVIKGGIPLAATLPGDNRNGCCWQCGMKGLNHWEAVVINKKREQPQETNLGSTDIRALETRAGSDQTGISSTKSKSTKALKRKTTTTTTTTTCSDSIHHNSEQCSGKKQMESTAGDATGFATASLDRVDDQQERILSLMTQLQEARDETELVVRKADRRFEEEKRLRKAWNTERRLLQDEMTRLDASNKEAWNSLHSEQKEVTRLKTVVAKYRKHLLGFLKGMGLSEGSLPFDLEPDCDDSDNNISSSSSSSSSSHDSSNDSASSSSSLSFNGALSSTPTMKAPFCVICQANTADVMIVDCGHICICYEHCLTMQNTGQLKSCPVCKNEVKAVCKVRGLEPGTRNTQQN